MWYPKRDDVIVPQWAIEVRPCDTPRGRTSLSFWGSDVLAVAGIGSAQYRCFFMLAHRQRDADSHCPSMGPWGLASSQARSWCREALLLACALGPAHSHVESVHSARLQHKPEVLC